MGFLWSSKKDKEKEGVLSEKQVYELVRSAEKDIAYLENVIYGVALFFEGLSLLHAGQNAMIETFQKQFRNVIQSDRDTLKQAQALVDRVKQDPGKALLLKQLSIVPCKGYSNPRELETRACVLVQAYNDLFPGRPRSKAFTEDETFRLVEEASEAFTKLR